MGHNYNDLASIGSLLQDNVYMENVRIQSRGKTGSGPCLRRAPRQSNERARHPSAICMMIGRMS